MLFGGVQLAIDTTLVSPLHADDSARPGAAQNDGVALRVARRPKERRHPELSGHNNRCRLVVLAVEVGGRWSDETRIFSGLWRDSKHGQNRLCCAGGWNKLGDFGGDHCSLIWPPERLPVPWWTFECRVAQTVTSLWLAKWGESSDMQGSREAEGPLLRRHLCGRFCSSHARCKKKQDVQCTTHTLGVQPTNLGCNSQTKVQPTNSEGRKVKILLKVFFCRKVTHDFVVEV